MSLIFKAIAPKYLRMIKKENVENNKKKYKFFKKKSMSESIYSKRKFISKTTEEHCVTIMILMRHPSRELYFIENKDLSVERAWQGHK